jgi:hypothetical protein
MNTALSITSRTRIVLAALGLMIALAMSVASPPQAHAAGCVTLGHAYYIKLPSGFNYMSGFEGDKRYGIPLVEVRRGEPFQLGGNGIKPGTGIRFYNASGVMGSEFGNQSFNTTNAGSNCVVDQTRNNGLIGNVPNGTYRVRADYQVPSRSIVGDPVVDLKVVG